MNINKRNNNNAQATVEYILMVVMLSALLFGMIKYFTDYGDKTLKNAKISWRDKLAGVKGGSNFPLAKRDFYTKPVGLAELDKYQKEPGQEGNTGSQEGPRDKNGQLIAQAGTGNKGRGASGNSAGNKGTGSNPNFKRSGNNKQDGAGGSGSNYQEGDDSTSPSSTGYQKSKDRAVNRQSQTSGKNADKADATKNGLNNTSDQDLSEEEKNRNKLLKKMGMEDDFARQDDSHGLLQNWSFWKFFIIIGGIFLFVMILIRNRGRRD